VRDHVDEQTLLGPDTVQFRHEATDVVLGRRHTRQLTDTITTDPPSHCSSHLISSHLSSPNRPENWLPHSHVPRATEKRTSDHRHGNRRSKCSQQNYWRSKSYILLPQFFLYCLNLITSLRCFLTNFPAVQDESQVCCHSATQSPQFDISFLEKLLKIVATRGKILA